MAVIAKNYFPRLLLFIIVTLPVTMDVARSAQLALEHLDMDAETRSEGVEMQIDASTCLLSTSACLPGHGSRRSPGHDQRDLPRLGFLGIRAGQHDRGA
jgi:hypothetical protein